MCIVDAHVIESDRVAVFGRIPIELHRLLRIFVDSHTLFVHHP